MPRVRARHSGLNDALACTVDVGVVRDLVRVVRLMEMLVRLVELVGIVRLKID